MNASSRNLWGAPESIRGVIGYGAVGDVDHAVLVYLLEHKVKG